MIKLRKYTNPISKNATNESQIIKRETSNLLNQEQIKRFRIAISKALKN